MERKVEENDLEVKKEVKSCVIRVDIVMNVLNRIFEWILFWYCLKKFVVWMMCYKE